ncbi:MAG: hypothetical protein AAFU71_07745 [Cyanobacteria bacterium J06632_22]
MKRLGRILVSFGLILGGLTVGVQTAVAETQPTVALSFDVSGGAPKAAPETDAVGLSFELSAQPARNSPPVAPAPVAVAAPEWVAVAVPEPPPLSPLASASPPAASLPPPPAVVGPLNWELADLFVGGSDSLVAHAVGHAEGTRTANGGYTRYYNGHTDPGNSVWNLGTFSYQHGARSAAEADAKQLVRLQRQATELRQQAAAKGIELTLLEELNGIDLANQAPVTALDRGYIKWLERAKRTDMNEAERVVWARTRSFIHPDTGRWNAPGLGNTLESVTRDQRRRQQAISAVLATSPARLN